ncbi:hypothetical protein LARI1_G006232 [Lachnellula arida]|uniref:Uncharacterized protein n=2 Tax=Lachnellula TaxID=47830 RepID=A0A8T9B8H0_9HELO|nr:hypothetical protein LARI1_G006232 [Lachnellula arida]TVY93070.1 hypothetical protein LAWI1_G000992 [Lachnellula willkommii]
MPILPAIIHHENNISEDAEHSRELRFFSNGDLLTPPFTSFDCPGSSSTMSDGNNQVPPKNDSVTSLTPDEANRIIHSHRKGLHAGLADNAR